MTKSRPTRRWSWWTGPRPALSTFCTRRSAMLKQGPRQQPKPAATSIAGAERPTRLAGGETYRRAERLEATSERWTRLHRRCPPRTHAISNCARRPPSSLMALAIRRGLFTRTPYQHLKQEVVPRVLVPPEDGGGHEGNRAFAAMASVGRRPSKAAGSESAPAGSEGSPPWGNHIIYMSYMMLSCYNMFLTVSFYVFKTCP